MCLKSYLTDLNTEHQVSEVVKFVSNIWSDFFLFKS